MITTYILNAIFSAIPALGFAMVFNVPKQALFYCAFGGSITYTTRVAFQDMDIPLELATFLASTIIGIIALYWSKKFVIPRPIYTIPAIIPLLPGTFAFSAIINLIDMNAHGVTTELINLFIENGLKTIIILGGIGLGLALPSLYTIRYNRPIT
ncbi:threonine/serine exporter family protein [Poseidonibacter lekithochrous]|uniref:threonine/serine exporter family protein n=1 Tax=Poseidonibacter TaxID=2321187 RepID=UPI001C08D091|nr:MULTISPECIES: threonine/serine exporter family protein [Poseidonibacter]MBU3015770.1 threonine/serine exporter family protein [Poseidonibacter lekithochrous]MDO6829070.1 threonine/serine exporter family protein [Poseidonibacter sp. 1_MG-2023]